MSTNQLKKITIAVSVGSIKESVYALSALQCWLSPSRDDPPPIITCDRSRGSGPAYTQFCRWKV